MSRPPTYEQLQAFASEITEAYLVDGRDHSAAELATITGRPIRLIRAMLKEDMWRLGIRSYETTRATFSRDYPMIEVGVCRHSVYGPRRHRLRDLIHTNRDELARLLVPLEP